MGQAWAAETKGVFIDSASSVDEAELFSIMNQALNGEVWGCYWQTDCHLANGISKCQIWFRVSKTRLL